jgi:plastocyanin
MTAEDRAAQRAAAVPVGGLGGSPTWTVREYAPLEILTGESVVFEYAPYHDVVALPSREALDACDFRSMVVWAAEADGDPGYVHTFPAAGTYYLACSVSSHCVRGQKLEVLVRDSWRGGAMALPPAAPEDPEGSGEDPGGLPIVQIAAGVGGLVAVLAAVCAYRACRPSRYSSSNHNRNTKNNDKRNSGPTLAEEVKARMSTRESGSRRSRSSDSSRDEPTVVRVEAKPRSGSPTEAAKKPKRSHLSGMVDGSDDIDKDPKPVNITQGEKGGRPRSAGRERREAEAKRERPRSRDKDRRATEPKRERSKDPERVLPNGRVSGAPRRADGFELRKPARK